MMTFPSAERIRLKGHCLYGASNTCISWSKREMILYVGVGCGVPLGELGLLYPLPQAAKNSSAPSTSRQNFAASVGLKVFLRIFDSPFLHETN
jgi:hypothetical protein